MSDAALDEMLAGLLAIDIEGMLAPVLAIDIDEALAPLLAIDIEEMLAGLLDAPGGVISSDETAAGPRRAP